MKDQNQEREKGVVKNKRQEIGYIMCRVLLTDACQGSEICPI